MRYITRTVWVLSVVSLCTDLASEMLYPVMPIYLKSIGFSFVGIGILEGIAEATAGLSKGYFGKVSDQSGKRMPFVRAGYGLSAISKPMLAAFTYPLWVFFARTLDRFGKGIRTGARDAMLSAESTPEHKAKIFGFHRAMDTLGAVLGPLFALIYLSFYPQQYAALFLIAFVPGALAVAATFLSRDKVRKPAASSLPVSFFSFIKYWKSSPEQYRKLCAGLLVFALINSSDVFLLLKARDSGMDDRMTIALYIFYNLVYAGFAFPAGIIADKTGLKNVYILGLVLFSVVYTGMGFCSNIYLIFGLFFLYGVFAAATEGISKAWISNISDNKDTATAIGTYSALQSICTLFASSIAGIVWFKFGAEASFYLSGSLAFLLVFYFILLKNPVPHLSDTP